MGVAVAVATLLAVGLPTVARPTVALPTVALLTVILWIVGFRAVSIAAVQVVGVRGIGPSICAVPVGGLLAVLGRVGCVGWAIRVGGGDDG